MPDSLIEQVRKAANRTPIIKTVEPLPVSTRQEGPYFPRKRDYDELDLRLVLALVQAQQAVVDAARELRQAQIDYDPRESPADVTIKSARLTEATNALDAALEKVKP